MSQQEQEATLTLKDRINFPYILANQILTFQKAILSVAQFSDREIQESIKGFVSAIPTQWKDTQFQEDEKKAVKDMPKNTRPTFCGIPASDQFCKQHKIELDGKISQIDYYKLFQACIDLLERKGLLSKIYRVEELEGIDDNPIKPDILESEISSE